ncbi:hypothetical protein CAEBREN_19915 [Caenorhabditis brenneri]|uniref:Uncharacterized protein n=1 Tax=Caenorhabditis brenneri TaxID=135651 RepID=G0N4H4_CAEBE|nr:hypothetical protein CAEBREN_19915 [Caenorhabditis brenneri]
MDPTLNVDTVQPDSSESSLTSDNNIRRIYNALLGPDGISSEQLKKLAQDVVPILDELIRQFPEDDEDETTEYAPGTLSQKYYFVYAHKPGTSEGFDVTPSNKSDGAAEVENNTNENSK